MYDITFLGNAPVDILINVSESLLQAHGLEKGNFMNVSATTLAAILEQVPEENRQVMPGGSGANTAHAFASLGGKASLCAYVGDDPQGQIFYKSMVDAGIDMPKPVPGKRSLVIYVLMTPDGERTFVHTSGDASLPPRPTISEEGLMEAAIKASDWLYIEGYLFGEDFHAILHACRVARQNNTKIALTLAASHFINTYFNEMALLIRDGLDLYICNEQELATLKAAELSGEDTAHAQETMTKLRHTPHLVTAGSKGATFHPSAHGQENIHVATTPPETVVDTTGAGDAFAAGYFYGLLQNKPTEEDIKLGHKMAKNVIQQVGARVMK